MIPNLLESNGEVLIGPLTDSIKGIAIEERNGLFEIELVYPFFSPYSDKLLRGNIIVVNANDKLKNQKFRIYKISKPLSGKITVLARHISYDLLRDYIESIDIENQSCEYALNSIFRASQFCKHFVGVSDIINAQDFHIADVDPLRAIAGVQGSILDTYGTGAELLRDNTTIKVLNKRGHDNGVTIEYKKNLTGFNYTLDETGLATRLKPYAKYRNGNEEITVYSTPTFIDSPRINDYETPFIKTIDFSSHFDENNPPTPAKLKLLAEKHFIDSKCDIPKMNYKIEFIPLSKCVGYEGLEDQIELCDLVTIKNSMYNITTISKVIKAKYDFLRERYESMELGEAKTTLGNVIGGGSGEQGPPGPQGPQGPPGADGSMGDFPDSLPPVPQVTATVYGFASIELKWTYENKPYYNYELYASKTENFEPNVFNLIFSGQASAFLHQVKPNETWYYKARAVNSHSKFTDYSIQVKAVTRKVDDMENYFDKAAIGNAVVGVLTADYMTAGIIKGHWIDARNLSVTDGNGKRTLDIDSAGNVDLDVNSLKIRAKSVSTEEDTINKINTAITNYKKEVDKEFIEVNNAHAGLVEEMNGAFKDGIIEETEAKAINERLVSIEKENADIEKEFAVLYNNANLEASIKSDLLNKKNSHSTAYTNLKNSITNAISNGSISDIELTDINNKTLEYQKTFSNLKEAFSKSIDSIGTTKVNTVNKKVEALDGKVIETQKKVNKVEQEVTAESIVNKVASSTEINRHSEANLLKNSLPANNSEWHTLNGGKVTFISSDTQLKIHIIDTKKQADAILIQENGKNILIDCGYDSTINTVIEYLKSNGVGEIDLFIATHAHTDHVGGIEAICNNFAIKEAIVKEADWSIIDQIEPQGWGTSAAHRRMIEVFKAKGIQYREPKNFDVFKISDYGELRLVNTKNYIYDEYNTLSIGVLYKHYNNKIFLASDMTKASEKFCAGEIGEIDILKVGHHGANGSNSEMYINELKPKYGLITTMDIDHIDRKDALGCLQWKGVKMYDTGNNGTFVITSTKSSLHISNLTREYKVKSSWWHRRDIGDFREWVYYKSDGTIARNETVNIGGGNYEFDEYGICKNPY